MTNLIVFIAGRFLQDAAQAKLRSGAAGGPVPPSLPQLSARRSTHALLPEKLSPPLRLAGQNGAGSGQTLQDTAVPAFKQTPGMYHNIAKTQISGFFKRVRIFCAPLSNFFVFHTLTIFHSYRVCRHWSRAETII